MDPAPTLSATRTAALVGDFDRSPAYTGLAEALVLLIGDGRVPAGTRLPSERDLTDALGVSRTTVTRAYTALREAGYAEARQGSGTYARVPGGPGRTLDHALVPRDGPPGQIDLGCAAGSAPPHLAAAYADAAAELPAYLGGHGYFPTGLPALQAALARTFDDRGLPTAPEQVLVTAGALSATAIVAQALARAGDRVVVETPVYPNAVQALRATGARVMASPIDPDGWDVDAAGALLRRVRPRLSYLIPDFQNPTGLLMPDEDRARLGAHLRAAGTVAVVDEAHQALALDPGLAQAMPLPFAAHHDLTVTVGSASKAFWGGLRLGWVRVPADRVGLLDTVVGARVGLDLGAPVLEQLALVHLLARREEVLTAHRDRLREQRDALAAAVAEHLPAWRFRVPAGGLALWCELPDARAVALCAAAERHGVVLSPGPAFAVAGGLGRHVRIPWTRPAPDLRDAVRRVAAAWAETGAGPDPRRDPRGRVMVA